jgi:hypothetical protein
MSTVEPDPFRLRREALIGAVKYSALLLVHADQPATGIHHEFVVSGFFLTVKSIWAFVTAGHCFWDDGRGLCDLAAQGWQLRTRLQTANGFSPWFEFPCHFAQSFRPAGVDCGGIILTDALREELVQDGVAAYPIEQCFSDPPIEPRDHFYVIGCPDERFIRPPMTAIQTVQGRLGISAVEVFPANCPPYYDTVDSIREAARKSIPLFFAKINSESQIKSIVGMSGGPIIRVRHYETLRVQDLKLHAIQSAWIPEHRIIYGPPALVFGRFIEAWISAFQKSL